MINKYYIIYILWYEVYLVFFSSSPTILILYIYQNKLDSKISHLDLLHLVLLDAKWVGGVEKHTANTADSLLVCAWPLTQAASSMEVLLTPHCDVLASLIRRHVGILFIPKTRELQNGRNWKKHLQRNRS